MNKVFIANERLQINFNFANEKFRNTGKNSVLAESLRNEERVFK